MNLGEKLSEKELCPDSLLNGQEAAFARDIERLQARKDEFVAVSCPACGGESKTFAFQKFTFTYQSCEDCRTIYMSPRPSPTLMGDYYRNSENYQYWAEHIFPASESSRREKINRPWLSRILGFCERYGVTPGHLVEVGPGFGTFAALVLAEKAFASVTAIEPTPEMAAACRERGVPVVELPVEEVGEEVAKADVLVAFEVIEHLFAPKEFLQQAHRLLAPGGLLVLSCPNGLGFDVATLRAESLAVDAEHVNLFNPNSLTLLAEACGFSCLEVTTPGRLDAEFVRTAVLEGRYSLEGQPFLQKVLVEEWDSLGWPFQQFLAENKLSSHLWGAFRKDL